MDEKKNAELVGDLRTKPGNGDGAPRKPREPSPEIPDVRSTDLEPYVGLRYLSKLFKLMAIILLLLLVAEVITGLSTSGTGAIVTLLGEASRLVVLAGLLWGVGDLAILLIDVGHDVRASRILLSRQVHHTIDRDRPAVSPSVASRSA